MNNMEYSFTRIKAFRCPFRFKKRYIEKQTEPAGEAGEIGRAVHTLIAGYRWTCLNRQVGQDPKWIDTAIKRASIREREIVARKIRRLMLKFKSGPMARMNLSIPVNYIEEKWNFDDNWKLLPESFYTGIRFRAIADFVTINNRIVTVIDDKTGGWGRYDDLQLKIYAVCALQALHEKNWPLEGVSLKFNLVGQRKVEDVGFYAIDEIPAFREEIEAKITEIESCKTWDPNPAAGACSYCGFHYECPAM